MPRNSSKPPNSFNSSVYLLSEYDFDRIANLNLLKESEQYRLIRDRQNMYDENAVPVYFGPSKIGYLERGVAAIASKLIDDGDVLSVAYVNGYKSAHYNAEHDNEKGDGYYRKLQIRITNESCLARAQGIELDDMIKAKYQQLYDNPALNKASSARGCMIVLIFFIILFVLINALTS
ncbi:HIRAN domain-containing protein [Dyadobacter crusticola]|uniref:HIRAN domain-containing protein n=1 Tax=Dyadobacter crusticola TaxID=292407 RepID=UPI0004E1D2E9|nr:HIRAN domain-containing protein [Dyadobacter crusticola]